MSRLIADVRSGRHGFLRLYYLQKRRSNPVYRDLKGLRTNLRRHGRDGDTDL